MTGEELYDAYCRKHGHDIPWDGIDPAAIWVWEKAAIYITEFGGPEPFKQIRSIKPGDEL